MKRFLKISFGVFLFSYSILFFTNLVKPQDQKRIELYGFVINYDNCIFDKSDPDWFYVIHSTRFPAFEKKCEAKYNGYVSVRQKLLGFLRSFPAELSGLKAQFECEVLGSDMDAVQRTFGMQAVYA